MHLETLPHAIRSFFEIKWREVPLQHPPLEQRGLNRRKAAVGTLSIRVDNLNDTLLPQSSRCQAPANQQIVASFVSTGECITPNVRTARGTPCLTLLVNFSRPESNHVRRFAFLKLTADV